MTQKKLDELSAREYVITRREMRALRDYWIDVCSEARREGDLERSENAFASASLWNERLKS